MKRVYKFAVPVDDQEHTLELTGPIVHIDVKQNPYAGPGQLGEFCVWAESGVYPDPRERKVRVFGTGQLIEYPAQHLGSAVDQPSGLVWHLYERKS